MTDSKLIAALGGLERLRRRLRPPVIDGSSKVDPSATVSGGSRLTRSTVGRNSYCGQDCSFYHTDIGAFCSIASRVSVGIQGRHPMHFVSTSPAFLDNQSSPSVRYSRHHYDNTVRTTIGNDVWIGENALIRGGLTIGTGAVIGFGSVVTKDVAPYEIVAGNPARTIRFRFEPDLVERLLESRWWEMPDPKLRELSRHFTDPTALMDAIGDT